MVDPHNITDFNRSRFDLEAFWIFAVCVAGKKADVIAKKVNAFVSETPQNSTPFAFIRDLVEEGRLREVLMRHRMGKFALLERSFTFIVSEHSPCIETDHVAVLEMVPGVGSKTSRFFVLHSRPNARVAVIDTHVLKYLKSRGHPVPSTIPTGSKYYELEGLMLQYMDASGLGRAEFDLAVWRHYATKGSTPLPESRL